jgi:hypothetical protein
LLIVVCPFVLFLLIIVVSVLLRYTDSDYPFGIFKLFLWCIQITPLENFSASLFLWGSCCTMFFLCSVLQIIIVLSLCCLSFCKRLLWYLHTVLYNWRSTWTIVSLLCLTLSWKLSMTDLISCIWQLLRHED